MVVGCGSIGRRHLRNLRVLRQTELLVYRSRQVSVKAIEQEFGVQSFFSLTDALAARPDVVVIANPTSMHMAVALEAAAARCHLFIEKPVSDSTEGTDRLLALVEQRGLVAMVGYNLRFHPAIRKLKEMVVSGAIGNVLSVRSWAGQYLPDWHPGEDYRSSYAARSELGGGVILTLSHELDYLRWLFGDVAEVTATAAQPSELEITAESLAEITLSFENGVTAHVHLDCIERRPSRGCELIGSRGTITCDLRDSTVRLYKDDGAQPTEIPIFLEDANQTYLDEMSHFIECIESGDEPAVSLHDGIAVLDIAIAAHRAAETGVKQRCR